jgi:hypothetical protein
VIDLLRKEKLTGMKSSMHRWRCVFATELDAFIQKVNAPRQVTRKEPNPSNDGPDRQEVIKGGSKGFFIPPSLEQAHMPFDLMDLMDLPDVCLSTPIPAKGSSVKLGGRDLDL